MSVELERIRTEAGVIRVWVCQHCGHEHRGELPVPAPPCPRCGHVYWGWLK